MTAIAFVKTNQCFDKNRLALNVYNNFFLNKLVPRPGLATSKIQISVLNSSLRRLISNKNDQKRKCVCIGKKFT